MRLIRADLEIRPPVTTLQLTNKKRTQPDRSDIMANRIDDGVQPTAHTALQAMIVRAQQLADQSGKTVGVHYDLDADQISLVEIGPDAPADVTFVRIAAPHGGVALAAAKPAANSASTGSSDVKAAPA